VPHLHDGGTLYDAIRYDDPVPIANVIRKTYIPNLDLMKLEHARAPLCFRARRVYSFPA
jgi:hypothetical protein